MAAVMVAGSADAMALCVRGVQSWDTLRLRSGPSPAAREIGAMPPNACGVSIVGPCRGVWCPIAWQGRRGWSNSAYLGETYAGSGGFFSGLTSPLRFFGAGAQPPSGNRVAAPRTTPRSVTGRVQPRRIVRPAPAGRTAARPVPSSAREALPPAPLPDQPPSQSFGSGGASPPPLPASGPAQTAPSASAPTAATEPPLPQPRFTAPATAQRGDVCIVGVGTGDTLRVRAGPGTDHALRYGYPGGACGVKITGTCSDGWCPVDYRGYRGWAEQKHLK